MGIRIGNVVFDAPASTLAEYGAAAGGIAALYAELLGMRLLSRGEHLRAHGWPADEGDDVDPLVMDDDAARPNLAFEFAEGGYVAPAWPDPERPQQVHLDVSVPDVDAADAVVRRHGGRLLLDAGDHRVYADVVGHPLCVFAGSTARIERIVFDCFSPRSLARFWGGLLGWKVTEVDSPERVELRGAAHDGEGGPALAFQHAVGPAPRWPDPALPQQLHLDLGVEDVDVETAQARALELGAVRLPYLGGGFVFADPAGHPFCLGE